MIGYMQVYRTYEHMQVYLHISINVNQELINRTDHCRTAGYRAMITAGEAV